MPYQVRCNFLVLELGDCTLKLSRPSAGTSCIQKKPFVVESLLMDSFFLIGTRRGSGVKAATFSTCHNDPMPPSAAKWRPQKLVTLNECLSQFPYGDAAMEQEEPSGRRRRL